MSDPLRKLKIVAVAATLFLAASGCGGETAPADDAGAAGQDAGTEASADAGTASDTAEEKADFGASTPLEAAEEVDEVNEMNEMQGYPYGAGVFCWDHLADEDECRRLSEGEITEIYQYIKPDYTDEQVCDFIALMSEHDIAPYILAGEPEWCIDARLEDIKLALDRVSYYNDLSDGGGRLGGIVLDIEPYVLKGWENNAASLMDQYAANIAAVREYIDEEGLETELCLCVPYSFDLMGYEEQLKGLIKSADKVLVLNYNKRTEAENIRNEVALADQYGRKIINVFELQPAPLCPEPEKMSYFDEGLPAAKSAYYRLLEAYPDSELGIAYHTLNYFN